MPFWWECKWCSHYRKQYGSSSEKLNTKLPYDPAISLLSISLKQMNIGSWRNIRTPVFIATLFIIARKWRQCNCLPTNEWIKLMWYKHTKEYYSTLKSEILSYAATWLNFEDIVLSETSQSQKEDCSMIPPIDSIRSSRALRNYKWNVFTGVGWWEKAMDRNIKPFYQWIELQSCNVKILWRSFAQQWVCG